MSSKTKLVAQEDASQTTRVGRMTFHFKVTADDGFSIRIDGVEVFKYDANQSPTARVSDSFNIAQGGNHQIEILYWDQGGNAQLKVELAPAGGSHSVLGGSSLSHPLAELVTNEDTALTIAANTLLGNDSDIDGDSLSILSVQGAGGNIQQGKLRPLAITSLKRSPLVPDVPTMAESGYPDFQLTLWYEVTGPKGMPADVVAKLNKAINAALAEPDVREKLQSGNTTIVGSTPDEARQFVSAEMTRWNAAVRNVKERQ